MYDYHKEISGFWGMKNKLRPRNLIEPRVTPFYRHVSYEFVSIGKHVFFSILNKKKIGFFQPLIRTNNAFSMVVRKIKRKVFAVQLICSLAEL